MKLAILLAILLLFTGGCLTLGDGGVQANSTVYGTDDLLFDDLDFLQLDMKSNGTDCQTEYYETSEYSPLAQYSICYYTISSDETQVAVELKKFTNLEDLNGAYQYDSLHLYSVEGLISENDYGDQSRFRVNNENDYGGQYDEPGIYYYHFWVTKNEYFIHVTSKGTTEAEESIAEIGRQILSKFE